jgi:hypothetical protein
MLSSTSNHGYQALTYNTDNVVKEEKTKKTEKKEKEKKRD